MGSVCSSCCKPDHDPEEAERLLGQNAGGNHVRTVMPRQIACLLLREIIPTHVMELDDEISKVLTQKVNRLDKEWTARYTGLPIQMVRLAGSRAEGINCPTFFKRGYANEILYSGDSDIMLVIDTSQLGYDVLTEPIPGCDTYTYLRHSSTGDYMKHADVMKESTWVLQKQGPAMSKGNSTYKTEKVMSIPLPSWPEHILKEWASRSRKDWPSQDTILCAQAQPVCLVPAGRKDRAHAEFEWRYSFSFAEVILVNSIPFEIRYAYRIIKMLYNRYMEHNGLSTYLIKTVLLNMLERTSLQRWAVDVLDNVEAILDGIIAVFTSGELRHHFIRDVNMLSHMPAQQRLSIVAKVQPVRNNLLKYILHFNKHCQFRDTHPSPIVDRVPTLSYYIKHPCDRCDWGNLATECLKSNLKFAIPHLHSWLFLVDLSQTEKISRKNLTEEALWNSLADDLATQYYAPEFAVALLGCHRWSRAVASHIEDYKRYNSDISSSEIVDWIMQYVMLHHQGVRMSIKSMAFVCICAYVNHRKNDIYLQLDKESSVLQYKQHLSRLDLDKTTSDSILYISGVLTALQPIILDDEFSHDLRLLTASSDYEKANLSQESKRFVQERLSKVERVLAECDKQM